MAKRPWLIVSTVVALILVAAGLGLHAWWREIAYVPPLPERVVTLPSPNGRDDFLAAIQLLPANAPDPRNLVQPPTDQRLRWAAAVARPAIRRLRVGLERQYLTPPLPIHEISTESQRLRQLARLLAATSELERREGQVGPALASAFDVVRMGLTVPRGGMLSQMLDGAVIERSGLRQLDRITPEITDPQAALAASRKLLALDAAALPFSHTLEGERDATLVYLTELLQGKHPGDVMSGGPMYSTPLALPFFWKVASIPRRRMLASYRASMDQWGSWSDRPYPSRGPTPAPPVGAGEGIIMDYTGFARMSVDLKAMRRIVAVRLACRAYHLRNRRPPSTLTALVPQYLAAVPEDPYTASRLAYRVRNGSALVYSLGPDGKDDGGKDAAKHPYDRGAGDVARVPPEKDGWP